MTACREQFAFSFGQSTRVVADFKGGLISSDAGLLPLRELDDRLGWTVRIAACLSDPRDPARVEHHTLTLLRQRLFAMIAGYEDANDHTRLRHDPILKTVADRDLDEPLASQPTQQYVIRSGRLAPSEESTPALNTHPPILISYCHMTCPWLMKACFTT